MSSPTNGPPTVLTTARLTLREMNAGDLDFVAGMLGDPIVMRFYPKLLTRDEAAGWIERQLTRYSADGHGFWLTIRTLDARPVGQVGLLRQRIDGVDELEVAYLLASELWGQGYATEAAGAVRDHAFARIGASRVSSLIRPENEASRGVARRLGMRVHGLTDFGGFPHEIWRCERPVQVQTR